MNTINPLLIPLPNSKVLEKKKPPGGLNRGFTVRELRQIFACVNMSAWSVLKGLQGGGGGGGGWVNDTNQKLMDTYLKPFFLEQKTSLYKQPYSDSQIKGDFSILMVARTQVPAPLVLSTVICQVLSVFSSSLYIYNLY